MQKHSNNGNDIGEVIGVDESILSKYKKHINQKYNNYTKSTTTSFLLKGCAAFFTTGKVSGWLAVHVSREKYFFFKNRKKSCTYITIIIGKKHKKMPPRKKKVFQLYIYYIGEKMAFFKKLKFPQI